MYEMTTYHSSTKATQLASRRSCRRPIGV